MQEMKSFFINRVIFELEVNSTTEVLQKYSILTENLPILTGKTLSLISLLGLYMRLLDSISILNSKQSICPSKHVQSVLFHCSGIDLVVTFFYRLIVSP